ncbi:YebC/PmpR family DNA-binding transcriptional regulator [Clostridium psychrophilum]|uniref:YebC/PmpR family DNA-binding transcriptional regulator n=1 Tax=Clostridium psychrophilum TaxID=132926 RepID=UPI001C0CEA3B|nr:YebC/PmpR family DNA-binding transcriptional regulator [Clostridium psychrophilum]MBU3180039.1 YebC/PmpR family DNA-binding transcriptional regulator [Clostridium psychrophilum]
MSGHSKWHNIQQKKGKIDVIRGKVFTKLGKEIIVAAKNGGSKLDANAHLRDVVAKAKSNNMPLETINRAIKKGAGELEGVNYEEIVYEGYGAEGVAIVVVTLTDKKNRSVATVRHAFDRHHGNMGSAGCVSWMFAKKGQIIIERTDDMDEDEVMMIALDAGAEDFNVEEEMFEIITSVESFGEVRESLEKKGFEFASAQITMIPDNMIPTSMEGAAKVQELIDMLEDNEDVQDVYNNAEYPEEFEG